MIVIGGHAEKWLEMSYNKCKVPLLPFIHRRSRLNAKHMRSRLNAKHIHEEGHQGVSLMTNKVRSSFWIIGLPRMVKSIRYNGVTYKKLDKKTVTQLMGWLPQEGLKVAAAWNCTAVDLFGSVRIRGEPQAKRMASSSTALAREQYT